MAENAPSDESKRLLAAVLKQLTAKGIVTPELIAEKVRTADQGDWSNGARVVVRAWTDPEFKAQLLSDGLAAVEQMGFATTTVAPLGVVENTPDCHNLVVCTLCSCYPRWLLGFSPVWYRSPVYRARAVREPRKLLQEWGVEINEAAQVRVVDSTADYRWMVLPMRPEGTEGWSDERLMSCINADALVGADICRVPT